MFVCVFFFLLGSSVPGRYFKPSSPQPRVARVSEAGAITEKFNNDYVDAANARQAARAPTQQQYDDAARAQRMEDDAARYAAEPKPRVNNEQQVKALNEYLIGYIY